MSDRNLDRKRKNGEMTGRYPGYQRREPLFGNRYDGPSDFNGILNGRIKHIESAAWHLTPDDLVDRESIAARLVSEGCIEPISIDVSAAEHSKPEEREVHQNYRRIVTVTRLPFTGDRRLLTTRPAKHPSLDSLEGGSVTTDSIELEHQFDPATVSAVDVRNRRASALSALSDVVSSVNEKVAAHNESLYAVAVGLIEQRAAELDRLRALQNELDV